MRRKLIITLVLLVAVSAGAALARGYGCWEVCPNGFSCVVYGCDGGVPVRRTPTPVPAPAQEE